MRTTLARLDPRHAPPVVAAPHPRGWSAGHVLAAVVLAGMTAASLGGLFLDGFYTDDVWAESAFRGNDLATLVVAVPILAAALALSVRGSVRGRLVTVGMLWYAVYDYAFYVFGARWSDWFLLHVATFATAIVALVLTTANVDVAAVARYTKAGVPRRPVAIYSGLVGAGLAALWIWASLRFAVTGRLDDSAPREAMHVIFAIDLSLMAPAFLSAAVLLWRRHAWGVVAAVAVNVAGAVYQVALSLGGQFQADAGIAGKSWFSPSTVFVLVASAAAAGALLLRMPGDERS